MHKAIWIGATCIALIASGCATVAPPAPAVPRRHLGRETGLDRSPRGSATPSRSEPAAPGRAETRHPARAGHRRSPYSVRSDSRCCATTRRRVRRRAALAVGRVGLAEGVEPLTRLLDDSEIEVRQMAAFALGLIGERSARPALLTALKDPQPILQGRAAEALGLLGDRADADAVACDGAGAHQGWRADRARARRPDLSAVPGSRSRQAGSLRVGEARLVRGACCRGHRQRPAGVELVAGRVRAAAGRRRPRGSGAAGARQHARALHRVLCGEGTRVFEGDAGRADAAADRRTAAAPGARRDSSRAVADRDPGRRRGSGADEDRGRTPSPIRRSVSRP